MFKFKKDCLLSWRICSLQLKLRRRLTVIYQLIPAILSFFAVLILSPIIISVLKSNGFIQPIRIELPQNHQVKKGTPLMLGIVFFIGVLMGLLFKSTPLMYFISTTFVLFSMIGFMDDYWKASRQDPAGISGRKKLFFQFVFTMLLLFILITIFELNTNINIYQAYTLQVPTIIYFVVMTLFIVGSSNAINFTDGMDGLLGMVSIPTYFFFFFISEHTEIKLFSIIMIACLVGFLIYNIYPAKAFMGDTGSLAIGGSLSFMAVIEKVELLIPIVFSVYFAEKISVILQVFVFKTTGKRLFRMAPIHYHFGLKYGWSENTIVSVFALLSWVSTLLGLLIFSVIF
jgi:phospho-N-acetylmuramoyl-pentapeptide-transferase